MGVGLAAHQHRKSSDMLAHWAERVGWMAHRWPFRIRCARRRARAKLESLALPALPARVGPRLIRHLRGLRGVVAPWVQAAVWGLAWSRWPTARRFQSQDAAARRCLLGCGRGVVREFARRRGG